MGLKEVVGKTPPLMAAHFAQVVPAGQLGIVYRDAMDGRTAIGRTGHR